MLAKLTFLLIDLMPVLLQILNRNNIHTEFYFEMQKAILPPRAKDMSKRTKFGPV